MSASREKKSRQESLAGGYVDPRTKREKDEQAKDRRSNALYIAIAVIFVIVGIVVTVANSKVIERNADAVTIGNETYTAADVSYFYNTIYSSFVSKNSYYLSAYGLDTSKSLKEQDCPINGSTWYDYFRDQALESLKSYALLAQKAEAEGFDGSEEVEQSVQDTFADLDAAAASAGYTRAQHIKAVCGPLVNEKVFERNIRMIALAQAYSDSYSDSLSYTSDEVQAAYDADPKSYQSADIEYILFTSAAGDDATDEEKAELLEQAKQKAETALSRYAQGETFDTIGEDMEGSYAHIGYAENGASDMLTWAFDDARQEGALFQHRGGVYRLAEQLPDVVHPAVAGGVQLRHVQQGAAVDAPAGLALVAGGPVLRVQAVDGLGQNPGAGGFAGAPGAGEQIGVGRAALGHLPLEGAGDVVLAHHLGKGFGPPFPIQCLIHEPALPSAEKSEQNKLLRCQPRGRWTRGTWMIPLNAARFPA